MADTWNGVTSAPNLLREENEQLPGVRIALLLCEAQGVIAAAMAAEGRAFAFGASEVAALLVLREGPAPISRLARSIGIRPNGASVLVERLYTRALVTRTRSVTDNRVVRVELTSEGREIADSLAACVSRRASEILEGLDSAQREQLPILLARIAS